MRRVAQWLALLAILLSNFSGVTMKVSAVETPAPAEKIVLSDDFESPGTSLFQIEEGYGYRSALESGTLRWEMQAIFPGENMSVDLPAAAHNGTLEVEPRLVNGTVDQYVAVGCRGSLNTFDAGYAFIVSPSNGYVGLYRRDQGINVPIKGYVVGVEDIGTPSGIANIHRVGLICHNDTLTGQINGVDVISATDHHFRDGYFYMEVGMFANATAPDNLSAAFDNLVVTVPPEEADRQRAQWSETATVLDELVATRVQPPLAGPFAGTIALNGLMGTYPSQDVGVEVDNFYATVQFHSFADPITNPWDGLLLFRLNEWGMGYIVLVSSAGFWEVIDTTGAYLAKGTIPALDRAAGNPTIRVEVAAVGSHGFLRVNESVTVHLDLTSGDSLGTIEVGAGILPENNRSGEAVAYDQLEVYVLGAAT